MKRRTKIVLLVGLGVAGLMVAGRHRLEYWALSRSVASSAAPSEQTFAELLELSPDPSATLDRLWERGGIPHRLFVMRYLRRHAGKGSPPLGETHQHILIDAVQSGDVDLAQAGLTILGSREDSETVPAALRMLADADPEQRQIALQHLGNTGAPRFAGVAARALDDPERTVRMFAAGMLATLSDRDIGMRYNDDASMVAGIEAWKTWWSEHRTDFPPAPDAPPASAPKPAGTAPDFELHDLAGQSVRLPDLRGRPVLLNFWATWCGPCVKEIPTLAELHAVRGDRLAILGICVDAIHNDHDHGHDHGAASDDKNGAEEDPAAQIGRFVAEHGVTYPVLLDADGQTTAAYGGEGLPTTILIDSHGMIRRRFIGPRTLEALQAMLDQIDTPEPTARR